jgi:hypothetical protein
MGDQRLVLRALRRTDLLALIFECVNLHLTAEGRLERSDPDQSAFVIVHFPAQHLAEQAFVIDGAGQGAVEPPPVRTAIAGGSRLAFQLPDLVESLPATLDALLKWDDWTPILVRTALPRMYDDSGLLPPVTAPGPDDTAIEFPLRLILSPDKEGAWHHSSTTRQHEGRVELWQTRLARRQEEGPPTLAHEGGDLRAVAVVERQNSFTTSLTHGERSQIVQLSSNFDIRPRPGGLLTRGRSEAERQAAAVMLALRHNVRIPYRPQPIAAEQLALSALGASARLHSRWDFPVLPPTVAQALSLPVLSLQQYEHIAGLGRDQYVKTVKVGFLCGTGHRASLVKVSERRFTNFGVASVSPDGALFGAVAYLHQYYQVVVQEPVMDYSRLSGAYQNEGREMPLRSIRLTTLVTPPLDLPSPVKLAIATAVPSHLGPQERDIVIQNRLEAAMSTPFWLEVGRQKFMFEAVAKDADDNNISFALPLMFVPYEALVKNTAANDIRAKFDAGGIAARTLELNQQLVAFAPPADGKPGATQLKTESLTYDIQQPPGTVGSSKFLRMGETASRLIAGFLPWITGAMATSPALEEMMGSAEPVALHLDEEHFLLNDFDSAQSFVRLDNPLALRMEGQRGGGLARPDASVAAISRTLGPTSNPDSLAAGTVDISAFAKARILGTIPIVKLLPDDSPDDPPFAFDAATAAVIPTDDDLEKFDYKLNAPRLITTRVPNGVETRYLWKPLLKKYYELPGGVLSLKLDRADLLLDARLTRQIGSSESSMVVVGRLRKAELSFTNAVAVTLGELIFRAEEGRKMEVGAKDVELKFLGPLEFVNTLRQILPTDGFNDPPFVNIDAQGISAGYTLGIPSVTVGIFSLQNITLGAILSIPFAEKPAGLRFNISERHKPFLVTVTIFGGGGFFALAVSANGLEQVEAAIEFGGSLSLNLGVASGGVFVMAGIYFNLTKTAIELTGYLRCGGYLEVLGLISISLEFYLAFTYRKKAGKGSEVWGQATLTVGVKVAFFSTSVRLSVERRFAGSDGDPTFAEANSKEDWKMYLDAFGS